MASSGSIEIPFAAEWSQLRRERLAVRERLARIEAERGRVSAAVLERVRADYERRQVDLDARAEDLAARATREVDALGRAAERQEDGAQRLRFELEEYDLRERLGEALEPAAARRAGELRQQLRALEEDLAALVELRRRVTAIAERRSSGHLPVSEPPAPNPFSAEILAPLPPLSGPHAPPYNAPPPAPGSAVNPATTAPAGFPEAGEFAGELAGDLGYGSASFAARAPAPTLRPRLVPIESSSDADAFPLVVATIVGRTGDVGLRLLVGTVSRRHAELAPTADGWVVRDLHSENGTWVNGERVWERILVDGDRVQFGSVALVYRDR